MRINSVSEPILFVDDTDVTVSSRNFKDFFSVTILVLSHMIKWFAANNLVQNLDKANIMEFIKELLDCHWRVYFAFLGSESKLTVIQEIVFVYIVRNSGY
jgi:hypothetical protein